MTSLRDMQSRVLDVMPSVSTIALMLTPTTSRKLPNVLLDAIVKEESSTYQRVNTILRDFLSTLRMKQPSHSSRRTSLNEIQKSTQTNEYY